MTDPTRTTIHVEVPPVSNVIDIGEILGALRDFAAREAQLADPAVATLAPGAAGSDEAALRRTTERARVHDLAGQLAELVEQLPELHGPARAEPQPPDA
jgi:hypothetical protein